MKERRLRLPNKSLDNNDSCVGNSIDGEKVWANRELQTDYAVDLISAKMLIYIDINSRVQIRLVSITFSIV